MMQINLLFVALLSSSVVFIDSASSPLTDTIKPVAKKKSLIRTTRLDVLPAAASPSDYPQDIKSGRCEMLGSIFAEGSAMASAHDCSFCYCIRGQRQCVTPRCNLPLRGCKPRYRSSSCCPTFYDCHDALPTTTSTTTTTTTSTTSEKPTTASVKEQRPASRIGCSIKGQRYFEGQFMPDVGGSCSACYCLRGTQQCTEMKCRPPVKGCAPVMAKGKCCPVRYDCETKENVISRSNGKLPRSDLLPEFGFKFDFDYDSSDLDSRVMENHVRIERQSESGNEPIAEESEVINTTEQSPVVDEQTTIDTVASEDDVILFVNNTDVDVDKEAVVTENLSGKDAIKDEDILRTTDVKLDTELQPVEDPILDDNIQVESFIDDVIHEEIPIQEVNNSSTVDIVTEHPDFNYEYDYDYEDTNETERVPTLSITEILTKLRNQNEGSVGSLADIIPDLPDPITGTRAENENIPESPLPKEVEKNQRVKTDFPSYDINVGTSLIAGEDDIVGVGHVIPIDLHAEDDLPHSPPRFLFTTTTTTTDSSTTTASNIISITPSSSTSPASTTSATSSETKNIPNTANDATTEKNPQSSFLNTFLSLFRGGPSKTGEKTERPSSTGLSPPSFTELPPPPFLNPISREENLNADIFEAPQGPPSFFRPPPMDDNTPISGDIFDDEFVLDTKNELDSELDLDSKPTIDNEIRTKPKPPNGSITRNALPIRPRRPTTTTGSKPSNPGLFATRPKLTLTNLPDDADFEAEPNLPSDPFVEGGFAAIRPASVIEESNVDETGLENEEPTLPPSLPNLKIIPFVAADALVNQGSPPDDGATGFTPRPFGSAPISQDCREGGKVWKNGEAVAKGDNDPCVLCRCLLGKVICQHLECPKLPNGCTAEDKPAEGECCPKITCDKSANVSIIDTLPSFRPIKNESEDSATNPIRPSPFSHQNRRPPFAPENRRPTPFTLRKPLIPPRLRPTKKPAAEEEPKKAEEEVEEREIVAEEESSKSDPRRPIRPFSRPTNLKPLRNSVPQLTGSRPRPFSYFNRTGARPSFVPPRRNNLSPLLPTTISSDPSLIEDSETPDVMSQTISADKASVLESKLTVREPIVEFAEDKQIIPSKEDPTDFENIFAGLLDRDSLPQPIHNDHDDELRNDFDADQPFILPSDIIVPKPLPPNNKNVGLDGEITNFVKQDKFRFTETNPAPEVKFGSPIRIQKPTKRLPEIPEVVKAQLPLGNDPILVSGLFELGGCNVYGRMFDVGEAIQEISGQCKACQCTKVGVQCLPIC